MMQLKDNDHEGQKPVSVLQGDGLCIGRVLSRESSVGQSSRVYYRPAEGIPFKWELQPGTPLNPQEDDIIPPLSPSPLMQSLGLPLPNVDHHDEPRGSSLKTSRFCSLKELLKKRINLDVMKVEIRGRRSKRQESSRNSNGDLLASVKDSTLSSDSSPCSSFSSNGRALDDGPFCCSPWNVPAILDEGNTRIYYCSQHKRAFAVEEENGSFRTGILSRDSAAERLSGPLNNEVAPAAIPFRWETQPGTPKRPPANERIPPPSPPPAVQSLALPLPRLPPDGEKTKNTWTRAWSWMRGNNKKKEAERMQHEISFRYQGSVEVCSSDEEFEASFSKSSLLSAPQQSKSMKRSFRSRYFGCGCWGRRRILVFARRK